MIKYKLLFCALIVAIMSFGIIKFNEVKPLAEDLPYLDGFYSKPVPVNIYQ
ncbi:MAG: hypothetical protein K0R71_627 [Bacillales bacterium]|jgi:hypothetical protein|nr:hypothetical protein [Bacillales bacterium]